MADIGNEDTHFYFDHTPPDEVIYVLRLLNTRDFLSTEDIAEGLALHYAYKMQKDRNYSPRRLYDLGLVERQRLARRKHGYRLSDSGRIVQKVLTVDRDLALDILHYLHYSSFTGDPSDRKNLWSYRRICEIIWEAQELMPTTKLAAMIQADMRAEFPGLDFSARVGARFNSKGAGAVIAWLRALEPSPVAEYGEKLVPRTSNSLELVLLGLDYVYRKRGYSFGDPVLVEDDLITDVSAVFFIQQETTLDLLRAARFTPFVTFTDTLLGPSITLNESFGIDKM